MAATRAKLKPVSGILERKHPEPRVEEAEEGTSACADDGRDVEGVLGERGRRRGGVNFLNNFLRRQKEAVFNSKEAFDDAKRT